MAQCTIISVLIAAYTCLILIPALISADCMCIGTGDPHYLMCDGKTFYDWQGAGLHQMFKTESVEVQCLTEKRGAVSIIDHCRIRVRHDNCDLIVQTPSGNSTQMIINGDLVRDPARSTIDPRFQTTITKRPDLIRVEITADGGRITLDFAPYSFAVVAQKINRCAGMCGDCTGPQKRPTNMTQFVEPYTTMDAIMGGNLCAATDAGNATSSTNSPSNGSQNATSAKPENGTMTPLMPVAPAQIPDDKVVPAHPVFETEAVMKQVYQQCLAGQEPSRMNEDAMFAAFVEGCIYDKSLGPGAEHAALSTMQSFVTAANHSRALNLTDWRNTTMRSAAPIKLDSILTRTVTKRPDEIAPNSGVTYELRHLYVDVTRPKSDYLMTRSSRWSSQSMQMGLPYESSFSTIASVENANNMSGVIAQKLRLHFDIEAPVVVIQPPSPNVRLEAKATPIASEADAMPAPRRHRIPIDDDKDEDQPTTRPSPSPSRITKSAPAMTAPPMPITTMPITTMPITPAPTTATPAPTPAPTTRAPVKQFQIATIVRQREVPASEIREAPPAPEIPLQVLQQIAQPAVQTLVARPAAVQPAPAPVAATPVATAPVAAAVVPMAAVPVQPVAAMAAQPVAAIPAQPMAVQPMAAMPAQAAMMSPGAQQAQVRPQQQQQQMRPANNQRAGILIPQQQMMVQHPVTVSGTPMMVGFGGRQGQMMGPGQMGTGQMVGAGQMMGAGQGRGWGMRGAPGSASGQVMGGQGAQPAGAQQGAVVDGQIQAQPQAGAAAAATGQASAAQPANAQAINGQAGNGQVVNGQAGNGQVVNGQAGNGQVVNGQAGNGQVVNGQAGNGQAVNGQAGNGQAVNGQASDGQSVLGQAVNGQPAGSETGAANGRRSEEEEERRLGRRRRRAGMEAGGTAPPDAAALGAITGQDGSAAAGGDPASGSDLGSPAPDVNAS